MLGDLLFPEIKETPQDIINKYPKRPSGQVVTRIAPSPTGFFHIGTLYTTLVNEIFAHKNSGVLYLRVEDTDQKRQIEGAMEKYVDIFKKFGINFDEGPIGDNYEDVGDYGPYTQSKREYIYKVFLRDLVERGLAYPCFLTEDEINQIRITQESLKVPVGIYQQYSPWRNASLEDIKNALKEKKSFVIRYKSNGSMFKKIEVNDVIKGNVVIGENFLDIVIMKTSGLPTYHFAHIIDDYLMGTSLVIRGDEWFSSLPLHIQMFETMGWSPLKYAHISPLVKLDGESKRKLSKRKDHEANIDFYFEAGYLNEAIIDYLCNLINSGYEDWRKKNPGLNYKEFDFKLEKMNTAGALVDINKLNFVNSSFIKKMTLEELYEKLQNYLKEYKNDFFKNVFLKFDKDYNLKIIKELQTRLIRFDEYIELTGYFYNDFEINDKIKKLFINPKMNIENIEIFKKGLKLGLGVLENRTQEFKSLDEIKDVFVQEISKAGMKNGQVLWPIRLSLSGEEFSSGALELIYILGIKKSIQRIKKILNSI